ncbi:MAG: hypothetical protein DRG20_03505 [Deltaproteobacteria bacterium]|nr:hypothetical protein [Deltaproteobacteria bacterium]RLA90310.1 MAG: hypothetical protein DRG20_03505 [Deltaproteobacteria bacterium]
MHLDKNKKYDIRILQKKLKRGEMTIKEYEEYLNSLPDVSHKMKIEKIEPVIGVLKSKKKNTIKIKKEASSNK